MYQGMLAIACYVAEAQKEKLGFCEPQQQLCRTECKESDARTDIAAVGNIAANYSSATPARLGPTADIAWLSSVGGDCGSSATVLRQYAVRLSRVQ